MGLLVFKDGREMERRCVQFNGRERELNEANTVGLLLPHLKETKALYQQQ